MKADAAFGQHGWAGRRIKDAHKFLQDLHNGGFVHIEPAGKLCLEFRQLLRELARSRSLLKY